MSIREESGLDKERSENKGSHRSIRNNVE